MTIWTWISNKHALVLVWLWRFHVVKLNNWKYVAPWKDGWTWEEGQSVILTMAMEQHVQDEARISVERARELRSRTPVQGERDDASELMRRTLTRNRWANPQKRPDA